MRFPLLIVGISLIIACEPLAAADKPQTVIVVTDNSWKGTSKETKDWQNDKGSEDGWVAAVPGPGPGIESENFSAANMFAFETKARWIWAGPAETCILRRSFEVPKNFRRAEMLFAADDVADIYINGRRVAAFDTQLVAWGGRGCALLVDLVPYLNEGKNLVALGITNRLGPKGFAAEIRIDGDPFVPRLEAPKPLPKELEKEFNDLAKRLDDDDFEVRNQAEAKLVALIGKHGIVLKPKLEALKKSDSAEVRNRADVLWAALVKKAPELDTSKDPRMHIPALTVDALEEVLRSDATKQIVAMRHLLPARQLLADNEKGLSEMLTKSLKNATDQQTERLVAFISFLEIESLDKSLVEVLQQKPKTAAAAAAASALGRFGKTTHTKALEEAAQCGYEPAERAAKHALRVLKERE